MKMGVWANETNEGVNHACYGLYPYPLNIIMAHRKKMGFSWMDIAKAMKIKFPEFLCILEGTRGIGSNENARLIKIISERDLK